MKILLLKPISVRYHITSPNLGLGYLAAIAQKANHEVDILDASRVNLSWQQFEQRLQDQAYDIIGLQMYTSEVLAVKRHITIIRERSPSTTILIGGPHISGDPLRTMTFLNEVDFGLVGEAELSFQAFLKLKSEEYQDPQRLASIPGLVWRDGEEIRVNQGTFLEQIDEFPFPAWDLIQPKDYLTAPHGVFCRQTPVAPIVVSRGCPYPCTFCAGKAVTGHKVRYRSVDNVLEEIQLLYHTYAVREIHIEDDNFTFDEHYVKSFCGKLEALKLDLTLALPNGVRLDRLNQEVLKAMERAGFYAMAVGIESGSDRVLKSMKKNLDTAAIKRQICLIKSETNISITGFFIFGYPGESETDIRKTISFSRALPLDKADFTCFWPLPGTIHWEDYCKKNNGNVDYEDFLSYRIVNGCSDIDSQTLRALLKQANWKFYARPRIIWGLIKQLRNIAQWKIIMGRLRALYYPGFENYEK